MTIPSLILAAALALQQQGSFSGSIGADGSLESRVSTFTYDPDRVVSLPVETGYAAVIELAPTETVDSVVVGNSAVWQVTTSQRGDRVVVKPLTNAATTDMIIMTEARRYVFLLKPVTSEQVAPLIVRFVYPAVPVTATAGDTVATYRLEGTRALYPETMRDDGQRTTIRWGKRTALPAVFAADKDGQETLVNARMVGEVYVIDGVAPRFVLRLGKAAAVAVRRVAVGPR